LIGAGEQSGRDRVSTVNSAAATAINSGLDYTSVRPAHTDDREPTFWGLTASAWLKTLIVTGLLVALFRFNLARLWGKANPFTGDANWGHTVIIPLIGLYYLFLNRDQLLSARVKPLLLEPFTRARVMVGVGALLAGVLAYAGGGRVIALVMGPSDTVGNIAGVLGGALAGWGLLMLLLGWGLGNLVFGLLVFAAGIYPVQNDWLSDYGMVHTIFGVVLTLCGWQVMRVAWFPIAFLVCGLPWPGLVYSWLASPLQHLAATVAVTTLNLTGIESIRSGTKMLISKGDGTMRPLNVAEACAGLRSLMTFISVAAAVAFLSPRALWQKVLITASAVPIAVFCNVMRVTGQAYLDRLAGPQWSEGFAHGFVGLVMLIPAFFLILGVAWIIDHLFVEEVDEHARAAAAQAAAAAKRAEKKIIVVAKPAVATAAAAAQQQPAGAATRLSPRPNLAGRTSLSPSSASSSSSGVHASGAPVEGA
jgi:exosortase